MINPPELEIIELFEKEAAKKQNECFSNIFRLNIRDNKLLPYRLSNFIKNHYKDRLYSILDYRQMMLAFILERVEKSEQEKLIQKLLPERLSSFLQNQEEFTCYFHEDREGKILCNRLVIKRLGNSNLDLFIGIESGIKEPKSNKHYHIFDKNILLVGCSDQDLINRLKNKYDLITADNLKEAVNILDDDYNKITVVLTGDNIPEHDVRELLSYINNDSLLRPIPVIVTILPKWEGNEVAYLQLGAFEIVYFPYSYDVILYRLGGVISYRESKEMIKVMERDHATGFLTNGFFMQYASNTLHVNKDKQYYYILVEIDNYQVHVEKYGEVVGDIILNHVANAITNKIPDIIHVGRLSDDKIVILREAKHFDNHKDIIAAVKENAPVPNLAIKIAVAMTSSSRSLKVLSQNAEIALAKIKQQYGVSFAIYNESMELEKQKELRILSSMEAALEKGQFSIYYQPKFDINTGKICGAEALVRWMHPEYGFMNPNDFIPLFERVGFIRGLDRSIFARVCQDIVRWRSAGLKPIPISINLSRRDFETGDLADWILTLLNNMNIPHDLVHVEVTESAFTYSPELIVSCVKKLHENGVVIELDDFGVGYSSLTMLNSMPIDILKIDKEIVQQDKCDGTRSILDFCVELAKVTNYKTVVEGIENESQLTRVRKLGCDYVQGFLFSKPIPVGEFEIFWKTHM